MIGSTLQNKRREKKISLKKASAETKVRMKYLIALEEENYDIFPADVYLKGFLKAYANYLGLNGSELVGLYEQKHPGIKIKPEVGLKRLAIGRLRFRRMYRRIYRRNLFIFLIGILAITALWLLPKKSFNYAPDITQRAPSNTAKLHKEVIKTLKLQANIKEITWIRVIADGALVAERNFYPGEFHSWEASRDFKIRIGNVWGADLILNGKSVDIITPSEQAVIDLVLDKEDVSDLTE
ncbi:MAG: helix-turn-helix domain-containing protein [bacterium]